MAATALPQHQISPTFTSRRTAIGLPIAVLFLYIALLPPVLVAMALKVNELTGSTGQAALLGVVLGVGALCAMVANPLAGRLSDRTRGRFGMRRPWIIGGTLVGYAALVLIAFATAAPLVIIGWAVAQTAFNAALAALMAVLPDQVPPRRRGVIAAALGVATNVALVVGTFIVQLFTTTVAQFLVPGAVGSAVVIIYALIMHDRVLSERPTDRLNLLQLAGSFVFNPAKHPDLGWAWLTRFLMTAAQATALTYLAYFLVQDLALPESRVATAVFEATLANVVGVLLTTFVAGYLSDKLGRRKLFVGIAGVVGVAGLLTIALSSTFTMVMIGELIMGIGMGTFYAVDLALIADVLPSDADNGKDLGVVNIAQALPQSLVPVAAPGVIAATGGYAGLFISGAVVGLLGTAAVNRIRGVR